MIRCPNCNYKNSMIKYRGVVLIAEGTASIDGSGKLVSLGPVTALCTVRVGQELEADTTELICQQCGYTGPVNAFPCIRMCPFTDKEATVEVKTPIGYVLYVSEDAVDKASAVFSAENAQWNTIITEDILHV